jgi:hypothetical protein
VNLSSSTIPRPNGPSSFLKKRVLVVDDEVDITTIFKLALEKVNLQVDVYNDPLLALTDYRAGMYDLLLFDIRMPGIDKAYWKLIFVIRNLVHVFGLPTKEETEKPMFYYERILSDAHALLIYHI